MSWASSSEPDVSDLGSSLLVAMRPCSPPSEHSFPGSFPSDDCLQLMTEQKCETHVLGKLCCTTTSARATLRLGSIKHGGKPRLLPATQRLLLEHSQLGTKATFDLRVSLTACYAQQSSHESQHSRSREALPPLRLAPNIREAPRGMDFRQLVEKALSNGAQSLKSCQQ